MVRLSSFILAISTFLPGPVRCFSAKFPVGDSLPVPAWGSIIRLSGFQSAAYLFRSVDVLLPENYTRDSTLRFPVLYMHDGQMLFDSSQTWNHQEWKVDEALRDIYRRIGKTCIVVAIHNAGAGRYAEYFPQKPFLALSSAGRRQVLALAASSPQRSLPDSIPVSDSYLEFLVRELKPLVDKKFRTRTEQKYTWTAGSSMGGLISLYALSEYPATFGAAICLSTHWPGIFTNNNNPVPGAFFSYLENRFPSGNRHRLYLCTGMQGLDSLYRVHHWRAKQIFSGKIQQKKGLEALEISEAGHSERDWQKQMPRALEFLLNPRP